MQSVETEARLARLIITISEMERQIEINRQIVAEQPLFEPYAAFQRIDREGKDYITPTDLNKFMLDNRVNAMEKECYYVLKFFDTTGLGRLSYTDFLQMVLPTDNPTLRELATQRPNYEVGTKDRLNYEIEHALTRLLEKEIELNNETEFLKRDLEGRYDFSVTDSFRAMDLERNNYVDIEATLRFLKRNGYDASDRDGIAFIRRLDRNADAVLSYTEFCEGILPQESVIPLEQARSQVKPYSYTAKKPRAETPEREVPTKPIESYTSPTAKYGALRGKSQTPGYTSYQGSPQKKALDYLHTPERSSMSGSKYSTGLAYSPPAVSKTGVVMAKSRPPVLPREKMELSPKPKNLEYELLIEAIREQISLERDIEGFRQDLALKSDFNLLDGFRVFDTLSKGFVTMTELQDGLRTLNLYPTLEELNLFMRRYDKDSDGRLRYSDFCEAVLPKQPEYATLLNNRAPYNSHHLFTREEYFTPETRASLRRLMEAHLDNETASEGIRLRLQKRPTFNVSAAFQDLDMVGKGYITIDNVIIYIYIYIM